MQFFHELIILEVQNEHDLEHDLEHKPQYSNPKIYDANGDLSKRWYVYFSYLNPATGKMERIKNIYGQANKYSTKESRYALLTLYRKRLLHLLHQGYNPFDDNNALYQHYQKEKLQSTKEPQTSHSPDQEIDAEPTNKITKVPVETKKEKDAKQPTGLKLKAALDFALNLKTNLINARTLTDYTNRITIFYKWVLKHHPSIQTIDQIDKKLIMQFLNERQLNTSSRNRNNFRTTLSTIFQTLEDNELIKKNFITSIKPLKSSPKRNKTYSDKQHTEIFEYLEQKDPKLLLYIKFISYNFLRPMEVCRLRVKDINIEEKTLQFQAKNKVLKTKRIPDILFDELPDLSKMNGDCLLFTPNAIGGYWDTELMYRRDYFTNRFKVVVKNHFKLDENYGLYSFRHTFITKLYRALVINSSPFAAKSTLMQITGHSTMAALEKYLRDIDAELPDDYSNYLK